MSYDKEIVKEYLDLEEIYTLLDYFAAEPQMFNNYITAKTICHNGDTHKLYFYTNTQLFKCYSGSCGTFDIFELVQKIQDVDLNTAIYFVVNFFNLQSSIEETDTDFKIEDWKIFNRYNKEKDIEYQPFEKMKLPTIPNYIQYYPSPHLLNWEEEGISYDVCKYMGIKYDPVRGTILIPHFDENNNLIGIRQRTLVQEDEVYGKYRPTKMQGKLCNHPLGFNLYALNAAKQNINKLHTVIVTESEKSVLLYMSYFGIENNICVAVCGSSLSKYQFNLLLENDIKEIVIAFDRDYESVYSEEYQQVENKWMKLYNKYSGSIKLSFLVDKDNLLSYKQSPLDAGKDVFLQLWKDRVTL